VVGFEAVSCERGFRLGFASDRRGSMHAHHAVVGAQTRKDLLRLGLLRPIEFRKQASGGLMDRIEGLLPNVEHPVHHVPSFLP
jgi:hypothetical protein